MEWFRPTSLSDLLKIKAENPQAVVVMGAQSILGKKSCWISIDRSIERERERERELGNSRRIEIHT